MENLKNLSGLDKLRQLTIFLRSEKGCPWDRKQNTQSLVPLFIEEVYELVQSILDEDISGSLEELGDVLFHICLFCHMSAETGGPDIDKIADRMCEKLIRRHPHVFGDNKTDNIAPDAVLKNWEAIKASEKLERWNKDNVLGREKSGETADKNLSIFSGVPKSLPALLQAEQVQEKASKIGFDWENISGPTEKIKQELDELFEILPSWENKPDYNKEDMDGPKKDVENELGDLIFTLVNYSRFLKISPEIALIKAIKKFKMRFSLIEDKAMKLKRPFGSKNPLSSKEMEEFWEEAKQKEKG